jgi:CheY-like chemotaxis protein
LRESGHTVTETSDPIHALTIVAEHTQAIDLILTDVEMEPISGFEFVKRLTLKRIHIPVQFVSGLSGIIGVIVATFGVHAVIEKPFTADALRKGVAKFLTKCNRRSSADRESGAKIKAA